MYEYAPKSAKKTEKLVLLLTLILAAACYGISQIPGILYPALYQLVMLFSLTGTVMITVRCLMRSYIYRVEPRENGQEGDLPDFTVTELYGRKITVVCRISLGDIRSVTPVTPENRKALSAMQKRKRVYHYTGELHPKGLCVVEAEQEEEPFFLCIKADQGLLVALNFNQKQNLSEI